MPAAPVIAPCRVSDIRARPDLIAAHHAETDPDVDLAPQWESYERLEAAGMMQCLGVFEGGRMLGYTACVVAAPLHHGLTLAARCTAVYVDPVARMQGLGLQLLRETEREAKGNGCAHIVWTAKAGSRMASVLEGLGYEPDEITYRKEL